MKLYTWCLIGSACYTASWGHAAQTNTAFITGYTDNTVYSINLENLSLPAALVTTAISNPDCVAISPDGKTVYVTSFTTGGDVYSFSATGPSTPTPLGTGIQYPVDIAVSSDGQTGYVVTDTGPSTGIWSFPTGGSTHTATQLTSTSPISNPLFLTVSGNTVYVGGFATGGIYSFPEDGSTYTATLINNNPTANGVNGFAVSNDGYLYFGSISPDQGVVYRVPISSPGDTPTQVTTALPNDFVDGIAISNDGTTLYMTQVGSGRGVYSAPLNQGFPQTPTFLSALNLPHGVMDIAISYISSNTIPLTGLKGNNLILASYLNQNAPLSTIELFSSLTGNNLAKALSSAAPTRNTISTYASQTTQLSLERLVNDHLGQQRRHNHKQASTAQTASLDDTELLTAASDVIVINDKRNAQSRMPYCCGKKKIVSLWLGAFGEYATAKPKHQTPDFSTGSGGVVVSSDYSGIYPHPIGTGAAYAHTHVHESEDAGHANIDQGDLFIYSTFLVANWYFDAAVWGGYYHSKNRDISFTGEAKCKIHGWQLSPHLEIGYDHWMNWLGLEPFTMIDYVGCWEHSANESGATPLNFGQHGRYCSLLRSETGLRLQEELSYCWGTVTLMEKGSYAYQKAFHTGRLNAFLIGSPGSFTVTTLTTAQNMGVGEIEILIEPNNKICFASLSFHTEVGSKYQSYQGMLEIGKDF